MWGIRRECHFGAVFSERLQLVGRTRQISCRKSGIPENALALGDVIWNSALLWLRAQQIDRELWNWEIAEDELVLVHRRTLSLGD